MGWFSNFLPTASQPRWLLGLQRLGLCISPSPLLLQKWGRGSDPITEEEEGLLEAEKESSQRPLEESVWTLIRVLELGSRLCLFMLWKLGQVFHCLVGVWWLLVTSEVIFSSEGDESVVGTEL